MTSERSTKRQQELLSFVDGFIKEHGYGPSYREIMNGLGYKSVSTVAVHINGLINKGYLAKRDNSARSLEVISSIYGAGAGPGGAAGVDASGASGAGLAVATTASNEKWLVAQIAARFVAYKKAPSTQVLDELFVLVGALKVLGLDEAYVAMRSKLTEII